MPRRWSNSATRALLSSFGQAQYTITSRSLGFPGACVLDFLHAPINGAGNEIRIERHFRGWPQVNKDNRLPGILFPAQFATEIRAMRNSTRIRRRCQYLKPI